jgi:hypothetical protein
MNERFLAPIRAAAGAATEVLRAEGRRLALSEALAAALSDEPRKRGVPGRAAD